MMTTTMRIETMVFDSLSCNMSIRSNRFLSVICRLPANMIRSFLGHRHHGT
jgi:hypothetical protein